MYVYDLFISFSFPLLISKLILPMNASGREKMDTLRSLVVLNVSGPYVILRTVSLLASPIDHVLPL